MKFNEVVHCRDLAIHEADTSIPISRLCFPAFAQVLKRGMAEMLVEAWL